MLKQFAKLLGVPFHAAEDALQSEKLAKHVIDRRGFLTSATALLCSNVTSVEVIAPAPVEVWTVQASYDTSSFFLKGALGYLNNSPGMPFTASWVKA